LDDENPARRFREDHRVDSRPPQAPFDARGQRVRRTDPLSEGARGARAARTGSNGEGDRCAPERDRTHRPLPHCERPRQARSELSCGSHPSALVPLSRRVGSRGRCADPWRPVPVLTRPLRTCVGPAAGWVAVEGSCRTAATRSSRPSSSRVGSSGELPGTVLPARFRRRTGQSFWGIGSMNPRRGQFPYKVFHEVRARSRRTGA